MLAVKSIKAGSSSGVAEYYENYQTGKDAGTPGQAIHDEPPGKWGGSYAAANRFAGAQVWPGELAAALSGFNPKTLQSAHSRAGKANHQPGRDLTFSASKSVSAVWGSADQDLQQAISTAKRGLITRINLSLIEKKSVT